MHAGDRLFVTAPYASTLSIVDISDPGAMVVLGAYEDTDCTYGATATESGTCVLSSSSSAFTSA